MAERREVKLEAGPNGRGQVFVDGKDITPVVAAAEIDLQVGRAPDVRIQLIPEAVSLDLEGVDLESDLGLEISVVSPQFFEAAKDDPELRQKVIGQLERARQKLEEIEEEDDAGG